MMLVEIIRTPQTSDAALALAFAAVQRIGKTPVVVGDCAGFLVNRLLGPYMNEAGYLLLEVADPMQLDRVAVAFGMPMGPIALSDLVGLEVAAHVAANLHAAYGDRMRPAPIWTRLKEIKSEAGSKPKLLTQAGTSLAPSVAQMVSDMQRQIGKPVVSVKDSEIVERLIYPVINEAAMCLQEGIARRAEAIDLAMVFGTGFAPFRGGPMQYALSVGLSRIVERLDDLANQHPHLAPSQALRDFATAGSWSKK
jgi:3-hydroxyacyl-CoA dehydrogenase/enoyl-CoA hydratase/3-hydroxybutyryl-CoA epimerase